jgi:hypothetical protein
MDTCETKTKVKFEINAVDAICKLQRNKQQERKALRNKLPKHLSDGHILETLYYTKLGLLMITLPKY